MINTALDLVGMNDKKKSTSLKMSWMIFTRNYKNLDLFISGLDVKVMITNM